MISKKNHFLAHEYVENELKEVPAGKIGKVCFIRAIKIEYMGEKLMNRCVFTRVDELVWILMDILWT